MGIGATIASHIATNVAGLTYGTNTFDGPVRPVSTHMPAKAVFVNASGGSLDVYADGGSGNNLNRTEVQILVRGETGDYTTAQALALSVYNAVRKATPTGTVGTQAQQAHPIYVGEDEQGHPVWSINIITYYSE